MISDKMKDLVKNNSVIREMFEEGKRLEKIYGKENVYDFSLGNPSIPAPKEVGDSFYCNDNKLTSLEGAPREVGGSFDCSKNTKSFTKREVKRVCYVEKTITI